MTDYLDDDFVMAGRPSRSEAELQSLVNSRSNDVRNLLSRGSYADAIKRAIEDPPAGRDSQAAKDRNAQTVMDALSAVKGADIAAVVKQLNSSQVDVLMKFIYRGMASPEIFNSTVLLAWHEKVFEAGGLGCVVRVLTDRQTL